MARARKWLAHELKRLLPVWAFFFVVFGLLRWTQSVILQQFGVDATTPSLVLVGSFMVAKAFLLLDRFAFVERFRSRPLIEGVLWKTALYFVGTFLMYLVEQIVELSIHHGFDAAWNEVAAAVTRPRFAVILVWLAILLFAYTAVRETIRAEGKEHFLRRWFGRGKTGHETRRAA